MICGGAAAIRKRLDNVSSRRNVRQRLPNTGAFAVPPDSNVALTITREILYSGGKSLHPVCCLRFVSDRTQPLDILSADREFICYHLSTKRVPGQPNPWSKSW